MAKATEVKQGEDQEAVEIANISTTNCVLSLSGTISTSSLPSNPCQVTTSSGAPHPVSLFLRITNERVGEFENFRCQLFVELAEPRSDCGGASAGDSGMVTVVTRKSSTCLCLSWSSTRRMPETRTRAKVGLKPFPICRFPTPVR